MFYDVLEFTQLALTPLNLAAANTNSALRHPLNPFFYHPLAKALAANNELFLRLTGHYRKPEFDIHTSRVGGVPVGVDERVVDDKPFCRLLHFAKRTHDKGPQLLIVAPLSGHYATLLRNTVETLLPDHDVFITDWKNASDVSLDEGKFDLSDYTAYVQDYIRLLGPRVHVLAVCQPTVPVLAAVALLAQNGATTPASMILVAGPIDPRVNPTEVDQHATARPLEWFRQTVIDTVPLAHTGRLRRVYPGYLQLTGFVSMNPGLHRDAYLRFYNDLLEGHAAEAEAHRKFYDEYNAVLDMPAEFYLETIEKVFQTFDLPDGKLILCGELVRPQAITGTALLTIEGERDDITGRGQTHVAQALCSGLPATKKAELTAQGVGHYGVFSGSKFRAQVAPVIRDFIRSHRAPD